MQVVHSNLGKLRHDEPSHPVGCRGRGSTTSSPAQRVNLGVVDPWNLREAGPVEKVVEEEHRRRNSAQLSGDHQQFTNSYRKGQLTMRSREGSFSAALRQSDATR